MSSFNGKLQTLASKGQYAAVLLPGMDWQQPPACLLTQKGLAAAGTRQQAVTCPCFQLTCMDRTRQ